MPQRKFYEDEDAVTPLPGTVVAATETEIETLGPNKLINGTSVRSPSFIEAKIENIRKSFNSAYLSTNAKVDELTKKYHAKEQSFSTTLANLHNKDEDLVPASAYILVATLSGSILTRRSNFVFKAIAPLVLGLSAFKYTLPHTFANMTSFAHKAEHTALPALAKKQDQLVKDAEGLLVKTETQTEEAKKHVDSFVKNLKAQIKKYSGLKIDEEVTKK
ncbi:CYFA0S06e03752g1_1 [Cyberlindnera fabianii]|uniref:MICOS complex subunit n=1 Tax=Cyberlindnera fabianii TaxID=36022 RepID=A0A061AUE5_CYBFA|nr:MICOS subunit MIC26 [Cyberlindnera fabianii]CDR41199.1 CYFA0S06e03752g1_1 [Cyberlindnera fabianii]